MIALALTASLAMPTFYSRLFGVSIAALGLAALLSWSSLSIGPRGVFWTLALIVLSISFAIPGSIIWGTGNWLVTLVLMLWMLPFSLLYLFKHTHRALPWLVPAFCLHTGLILYQGIAGAIRAGGLTHNPNMGAGFLVLGIVYLSHTRFRWLTVPMIVALPLTGSRWAGIVCLVVLAAMVITRQIDWRPPAVGALVIFLAVLGFWWQLPGGYRLAGPDHYMALGDSTRTNGDLRARLAIPHAPNFLPHGVAEVPGLHNVPLRMSVETGLVSAAAWVGITGWALWAPRRCLWRWSSKRAAWWMLAALVLLGMLDYYAWIGHLGGFWWLLVGVLVKEGRVVRPYA